jgi:hypothetical protein
MPRHRPPITAYGGLGGSVAAHRAELPAGRRQCRVCGLSYRGVGDLCPADEQAARTEPPQGPDTGEVEGPDTDRDGGAR